jgi:hypothetical protein
LTVWHQDFPDLLNVVVLVKTHLKSGKHAHVVLFTDVTHLASYPTLNPSPQAERDLQKIVVSDAPFSVNGEKGWGIGVYNATA